MNRDGLFIILVVFVILVSGRGTQTCWAQEKSAFVELGAGYGEAFKPHVGPTRAATIAGGFGANTIRLQVNWTSLANDAVGIGTQWNAEYRGSVVASRLENTNLRYERDLFRFARSRAILYAGGGLDYFKSRFTISGICVSLFCDMAIPPSQRNQTVLVSHGNNSFGPNIATGLRFPVWKDIGIRAEIAASRIPSTDPDTTELYAPAPASSRLVRAAVGIYYRYYDRHK